MRNNFINLPWLLTDYENVYFNNVINKFYKFIKQNIQ